MPVAPASRAAFTTSASCSGRSESPGRIGAMPTLARMPASTSRFSARSRWRGGDVPGSVVRQTSSSSVGTEKVTPTSARREASCRTSTSRTISGPRVISPNGVRRLGERLEAAARQAVAALGRLVRVGGGADRDRLAVPRPARQLAPQDLDDVDLDADRGAVAVVGRAVGAQLEGADVAERAAVDAPHVRVQRPVEGHAADAVQSRSAGLFPVLGTHGPSIERLFARPDRPPGRRLYSGELDDDLPPSTRAPGVGA